MRKLELEKLSVRRESLIHKFAISTFRNPEFRSWYKPTPPLLRVVRQSCINSPYETKRLIDPSVKSARSEAMPLCTYTRILNNLSDKEWTDAGLPPISSCYYKENIQLSGLQCSKLQPQCSPPTPASPSLQLSSSALAPNTAPDDVFLESGEPVNV